MGKRKLATMDLAERIAQTTSAALIQSSNHRDLLDIIDTLRSQGVSHYVDLPQIIVCGSQSSGKSSTLEALSGISFPTAEGLCTRFATELVLRRSDEPGIRVHIQPGAGRSEEERIKLARFSVETSDESDFPNIIESAKKVMGLTGDSDEDSDDENTFSTDVLRIESSSPTAPNLTLVDLPGLFNAGDSYQSEDDADMVQNLVVSYMKQRRSIILAVITADNPFANQPVTKFARFIDPSGKRTLGLITKPDKIDKGSESERYYVELAQNRNVKLSLGWHVLRNKSHTTADDTMEERDEREASFFKESVWGQSLDASQLGVKPLRERLRKVLWQQIKEGLPGVKSDVQSGIKDCENKLQQLGKARSTKREKHTYLQRISSRLSTTVRAAIDGVYADRFFESFPGYADALERRLRAKVQLILSDYAEQMRTDGHALEIVENGLTPIRTESPQRYMMRESYLKVVGELMIECRGRELPGTFNPLVVGDLFSRQCKPWEAITQKLVEQIHEAVAATFNRAVSEICDQNTTSRLMKRHIQPCLHLFRKHLKVKVDELLLPHLTIHPITYDDYLTMTVQETQTARHNRKFDRLSQKSCGVTAGSASPNPYDKIQLKKLLQDLKFGTRPDVEEYSASLAADVAAAYYQVALKKFIDDVSVNAVETCLIQRLPDVFSPDVVWDLSDEVIEVLGSEDDSTVKERIALTQKLETLEKGLHDLDAFTVRTGGTGAVGDFD
ncbi:P-loop containing nucleoside triphosphate hydrolase protein [Diplogelasinospora grovesii]|uniref:P-loop containing nucleoside triphosphate hydrolase protein n=1 Tax=Diplogelasinospora grovesii TaxID=303347 RepID=A0AAN6N3D3_9PEZI|nr:P-loop containing nucleoside triphosphate hydrolase protein [Diplogelasinospora grovesii]